MSQPISVFIVDAGNPTFIDGILNNGGTLEYRVDLEEPETLPAPVIVDVVITRKSAQGDSTSTRCPRFSGILTAANPTKRFEGSFVVLPQSTEACVTVFAHPNANGGGDEAQAAVQIGTASECVHVTP